MRVLILTIYFDPEPIPKTGELARELRRRGHEVHVVTAFPHYPSGTLYPGYRLALWRREVRDGVPILRTFIYPYHGESAPRRILNYLSWMCSSVLASALTPPCDVLYVWHPPLTVGVSAWVVSKLKRVPYVYDVQDLWPESALASGLMRPGPLVSFLEALARWVYARAPRILVVSRSAAEHLMSQGVGQDKLRISKHWINDAPFQRQPSRHVRTELKLGGRFVTMFAGNLGIVQGLETVVEAAAALREHPEFVFVLVGDGSDRARLEQMVADRDLPNVIFTGQQPADDMPDFYRAADALLVHLRPSLMGEHAIPTKVVAYLAAGRPIICASGAAAAEVVRQADAGLAVEPGDSAGIVEAVRNLAARPEAERTSLGERGRRFFQVHFRRDAVINEYEEILRELVTASRSDRSDTKGSAWEPSARE